MQIIPSGDQNINSSHQRQRWSRRQVIVPLIAMLVLGLGSFAPFMIKPTGESGILEPCLGR